MYFCAVLYTFCCSMYCLFCVVLCIVCVYMCTVLLPPGGYSIAVKYIISYQNCRDIKLTTYLHQLQRLRMSGAIPTPFVCFRGVNREIFTFIWKEIYYVCHLENISLKSMHLRFMLRHTKYFVMLPEFYIKKTPAIFLGIRNRRQKRDWPNLMWLHAYTYNNVRTSSDTFNPLNPELNSICYLVASLGAHHFLHVSRIRVKLLTLRRLMSYIYGAPILDVSRSHTTTQHSR